MAKVVRRKGVYLFLLVEALLFAGVYFLGPQGMHHVLRVARENKGIEQEIIKVKSDIAGLQKTLHVWEHDAFYQEKIARERLQMARKGDEIYYLM